MISIKFLCERIIMNIDEQNYISLLSKILEHGEDRPDRTGVGTKSIFGASLRFSLENYTVPIITTKKMFYRGIIEEALFFLRGETDTKKLEAKGVNIWKGNTSREFLDKRGLNHYKEGEMGPMYGYKWRNFHGVDQLQNAINLIKNDPYSRRIMISAYDPSASKDSVLDPCHTFFQFYVSNNNKLNCLFYMRSSDFFLGVPFNITSYAIITHIIAKMTDLNPGELIFNAGDIHIYNNHITQVKEQINRVPFDFPKIKITKNINSIQDIENLCFDDFKIEKYCFHPSINAPMSI